MTRILLALAILALVLPLAACQCGGQPVAQFGLPTFGITTNSTQPQTSVPVPMVPAYTVQPGPSYSAPAAGAPCYPPTR